MLGNIFDFLFGGIADIFGWVIGGVVDVLEWLINGLGVVIEAIGDILFSIFNLILSLLPRTPFRDEILGFPPVIKDFLGYANYYIPFEEMRNIMVVWGLGIMGYYGWFVVLRLIKAIK
jgi:hypothetical protein